MGSETLKGMIAQSIGDAKKEIGLPIYIKYHADIDKIANLKVGDWYDLRAAEDVEMESGDYKLISLGISMKLPEGYEAHIAPRSSTYKNFGITQTNSIGVVDNSYSGTNDIWKYPAYAHRKTTIHKNDRICQFRIVKRMPQVRFVEVEALDSIDRGGFGSTGTK